MSSSYHQDNVPEKEKRIVEGYKYLHDGEPVIKKNGDGEPIWESVKGFAEAILKFYKNLKIPSDVELKESKFIDDEGKVQERYYMKNGKENGPYFRYRKDGSISMITNFVDGSRYGGHYLFFDKPLLVSSSYMENDLRYGEETLYDEEGNITFCVHYQNDETNGKLIKYNSEGRITARGNYKDNELDGFYEMWNDDGSKQGERNYKNGKLNGLLTTYKEDGKTIRLQRIYKDDEIEKEIVEEIFDYFDENVLNSGVNSSGAGPSNSNEKDEDESDDESDDKSKHDHKILSMEDVD
jgi:antitoxin component YwqK of YwqJK toxin-antitoxin module